MTQQFKPSVDRPSGGESPLKRFIGVLATIVPEERTSQQDQSKYVVISFNFTDVEVILSDEPHPFPIAIIKIGYKPPKDSRGGTKWDAFAGSVRKLSPDKPDIDLLVGKRQRWAQLPFKIRSPLSNEDGSPQLDGNGKTVWGEVEVLAWKVEEVEGMGSVVEKGVELNDLLIDLADGKTEAKFHEAALTNAKVTADADMVQQLVDRKWLPVVMEMGRLTRDAEGILHKAVPAQPTAPGGAPAYGKQPY